MSDQPFVRDRLVLDPRVKSNPWKSCIFKTADGWQDIDDQGVFYKTRREARSARRARVGSRRSTTTHRASFNTTGPATPVFSGLERRLFDRLTVSQGVDTQTATDVILNRGWGYNQCASYGHMRAAGATDDEAKQVISWGKPDVSRRYGEARGQGHDHQAAVSLAFN